MAAAPTIQDSFQAPAFTPRLKRADIARLPPEAQARYFQEEHARLREHDRMVDQMRMRNADQDLSNQKKGRQDDRMAFPVAMSLFDVQKNMQSHPGSPEAVQKSELEMARQYGNVANLVDFNRGAGFYEPKTIPGVPPSPAAITAADTMNAIKISLDAKKREFEELKSKEAASLSQAARLNFQPFSGGLTNSLSGRFYSPPPTNTQVGVPQMVEPDMPVRAFDPKAWWDQFSRGPSSPETITSAPAPTKPAFTPAEMQGMADSVKRVIANGGSPAFVRRELINAGLNPADFGL